MQNQGLGSWIHKRRVKSKGHAAIIKDGVSLSYDELALRVDQLADVLRGLGAGHGSRVAYLGNNHPAFLETLFACGSIGAVFVPLNTRLAARELTYALNDSGSTVLISPESLEGLADPAVRDTAVGHRLVVADEPGLDSPYERSLAAASSGHRDVPVGLEDPAIILYTSGTTGAPKGAVLTHGNMTWNSFNVLVDYDVTSDAVALMIAPMFHAASLGMGALPTLLKGGTLVLQDRFEPSLVLDAIERHQVTSLSGVPTTYQMLAEHPAWGATDISSLRMLTCGGSAVPLRVLEAYEERGLGFSGGYGMTETAPGATSLQAERSREKIGSAGLPHFFSAVRVIDDRGAQVPAGVVGEILLSGPNVILQYWNRPEASAESYADDVWFRSGDMGYLDDEGFLYISDRLKDMIISGGENVYPAEIEQAIMELTEVSSVAVIGVPDPKWGEVPRAIVVPAEGCEVTGARIMEHLDGRIARYKIPRSFVIADELPRTASGKIRKADLRKTFGNSSAPV
ncbi:acyl-CoA synthetase [Paeniglutamicibacter cryotolerans]|uniref:Fatty-acyl-CoA synthase n=1 Tax=Paeniglutamicibacter cryotolerans TaxID=670079 RepID=A0A839QFR0_9MICC|nr:long-chain fatty acid--CoA ligase [Paeniglutamicibacter cryotolerans]MBB2994497.1 fatty-acyl-CoA synthase [Paeniglutamicibacter cryotolerans]